MYSHLVSLCDIVKSRITFLVYYVSVSVGLSMFEYYMCVCVSTRPNVASLGLIYLWAVC